LIGQTLSHYRITAALGAGGMGEVYRATDTSLGRDVAIKVLPPEVAHDPDRLGRFKREAQLLAALNHPHIAAIYGLEECDGKPFLSLELVEGEDLRQRLARGAIPVDEAIEIARQIAEALEEAHGKGIVHRDLKPANVKLTPDGKVKVLDFGLAKAWAGELSGVSSAPSALSQSPTMANSGTIAGVILGTAAYMSPEQARGKPVDKRADVWSFGVLLWEMLTGRSLFAGDTVTDVIAAVVTQEPDLDALPASTPRTVKTLISRCLRRDPRMRLPDVGAARLELQEVLAGVSTEPGGAASSQAGRRSSSRERWAWAGALLVALGVAGYLASRPLPVVREQPAGHFLIDLPDDLKISPWGPPSVSPDGRYIAYAASPDENRLSLWVRPLDSLVSRELSGTEGATLPFWSPDGQSLAFFTGTELRRIALSGGTAQKICALPEGFTTGGDWSADETIVFSAGGFHARLFTVPAIGGEARPLTNPQGLGDTAHWWPRLLSDRHHLLFQVFGGNARQGLHLATLDAPEKSRRLLPTLARADYQAGRLLFTREGTLVAQPLDVERGSLTGEPLPVAASVAAWSAAPDWGWFSASATGVVAYTEGANLVADSELVWFDRKGTRLSVLGKPAPYGQIALSPDERSIAVEIAKQGESIDIWTIDLARGVGTRQTFDKADEVDPVWSPDSRTLAFSSSRGGGYHIFRKELQGDKPEKLFSKSPESAWAESSTPDGRSLLYDHDLGSTRAIETLSWTDDADPVRLLEKAHFLDEPQVSGDGLWLAYLSNESGQYEVYVEPFGHTGERVRVSTEGGGQPKWRSDGKELFYVDPVGRLRAVAVKASGDRLELALPETLFAGVIVDSVRDHYAATRDGRRFLVVVPLTRDFTSRIHVLTSWTSLLERR
jgi:Tol biopolymer transport system component